MNHDDDTVPVREQLRWLLLDVWKSSKLQAPHFPIDEDRLYEMTIDAILEITKENK